MANNAGQYNNRNLAWIVTLLVRLLDELFNIFEGPCQHAAKDEFEWMRRCPVLFKVVNLERAVQRYTITQ